MARDGLSTSVMASREDTQISVVPSFAVLAERSVPPRATNAHAGMDSP